MTAQGLIALMIGIAFGLIYGRLKSINEVLIKILTELKKR